MIATTVPLISKRRQIGQLLQKAQHAAPSVLLLSHGVARLTHEGDWLSIALGASEVVVSALVIVSFFGALRGRASHSAPSHHAPSHSSIDWVDVFIGLMLAVEVWAHWHETGHVRRPTLLLVPIMIGLGLAHGHIGARSQRRRSLVIDRRGLTIGGRFFSRFSATWDRIAGIELTGATARIIVKGGGSKTIDLADLTNAGDVTRALEHARAELDARARPPAPVQVDETPTSR